MKVALYSPYLDTLGGGERYMMTIAEVLSEGTGGLDVLIDHNLDRIGADFLKKELSLRFNINLEKTRFIKAPFGENSHFFSRIFFLKKYDLLFYLTDGSLFIPSAKKNLLHIQSPLVGQPAKSLWGKVKLKFWNRAIYNSEFTKKYSQVNWPISSLVLYPPVDIEKIKPLKKKTYILSVGRFFGYLKDKKHEEMIEAFKQISIGSKIGDWSLHLAGSASQGDDRYLEQLRNQGKGLPIFFYPNIAFKDLVRLYGEAALYWHAAGLGEDDPTKMEHFGISTVEAMAAGCVPIVINKGGQTEIIQDKVNGYLWNNIDELKQISLDLINNSFLRKTVSIQAVKRASSFSKARFKKNLIELISNLN